MAKKNRRNLQQKINKQRYLQSVSQPHVTVSEKSLTQPAQLSSPLRTEPQAQPITGLRRLVFSVILVLLLLGTGYWMDYQTPYLRTFGDWLFQTLRLNS